MKKSDLCSKNIFKSTVWATILTMPFLLFGCGGSGRVIENAANDLELRNYGEALDKLLSLDEETLLKSDRAMLLLSDAYYGLATEQFRNPGSACYDMDFTSDGKYLVLTDFTGQMIKLYSYPELKFLESANLPDYAYSLAISPDNQRIAVATSDRKIWTYDMDNVMSHPKGKPLEGHEKSALDLVFVNNDVFISGGKDENLIAWNFNTGEKIWNKHLHSKAINKLKLSADSTMLVTASKDRTASVIKLNNITDAEEVARFTHDDEYVNDAAISPDNKKVVTVSGNGTLKIWDMKNSFPDTTLNLDNALTAVDYSPDGKKIVAAGVRYLFVIDAATGNVIAKIPATNRVISRVRFLKDDVLVFIDSMGIFRTHLLEGKQLIKAARKMHAQSIKDSKDQVKVMQDWDEGNVVPEPEKREKMFRID